MDPGKQPDAKTSPELKGVRGPLLASALLQVLSAIVLVILGRNSDDAAIREAVTMNAGVSGGLGVVFLGLWAWAKRNPLGASTSGLVLFFVAQGAVAFISLSNQVIGFIANAIVLVFLIRSVVAARVATARMKIEGQK